MEKLYVVEEDKNFQEACKKAGLPNHMNGIHTRKSRRTEKADNQHLKRQASKWRNKKGLAYKTHMENN